MQAAETKPPATPLCADLSQNNLSAADRKAANALLPPGYLVGVNRRPKTGLRPRLCIVKLPRGTAGKAPKGGVQIPQHPGADKGIKRVSKHWRQKARFKGGCERPAKERGEAQAQEVIQ